MKIFKASLTVAATLLMSFSAQAWDGVGAGTIKTFEITHCGNFALRVWLGSATCNGQMWSFLNEADSNYKVYVANLMLARAQALPVTLYYVKDPSGYCKIGHMSY